MAEKSRNSYVEPITSDLNSRSRQTPEIPVRIPPSATGHQSGLHSILESGNYQPHYTELSENQYEDTRHREFNESARYEKLTNQVSSQTTQQNSPESPQQNTCIHSLIICCAYFSLIFNCPVGIFSVGYAYKAKTEKFYPLKRYYLSMTLVLAFLAVFSGILIAVILTALYLSDKL